MKFTVTKSHITYTLTGRILENASGLLGVHVRLAGSDMDTVATTSSSGAYAFTGLPNGSYTLTPSKSDYAFTPPNPQVTINGSNLIAPDITAVRTLTLSRVISFVTIPGGTFLMGDVENMGYSDEKPVHAVTVSGFEMSECEITNAQYAEFLNEALVSGDVEVLDSDVRGRTGPWKGQIYIHMYHSSGSETCCIWYKNGLFTAEAGRENWPVVYVTWHGAKAFALFHGFDLPTEAEWEYACRGGGQFEYGTVNGSLSGKNANYWDNGPNHPVEVGNYLKNSFGLFDLSGNVYEWCHDVYGPYSSASAVNPAGALSGSSRVRRGGSWNNNANCCRSASRESSGSSYRSSLIGFRVVRRVSPKNY